MFSTEFLVAHPVWIAAALVIAIVIAKSIRIANQYERAVVFRLGKFNRTAGPGIYLVWVFIEWQTKLDLRTVTTAVEQQEGITSDNVPIKVDTVIWYRIVDAERAVMQVPATERLIFMMHDVECYEHERIARSLGITEDESRQGLHQARLRVRNLVSQMQR